MVQVLQRGRLNQVAVYVLSAQVLKLVQSYDENYLHIMEIT